MKRFIPLTATLLASAALAQAVLPVSEAEVRKVDKDAGKITLKHGEIKNLDMPPMSMVFQVKDKALLDKVKTGDKVGFTADKVNGAYTVMSIEPAK
ncbi:MAG: copper-binding protein [Polaromonas sp.]|nr:copper-binding protein [Polaromonas sp.]